MVAKLREILLTEHIGPILIALLLLQAAIEVVTRIVRIGFWVFDHRHTTSVLGVASDAPFRWDNLTFSAVCAFLYLLAAYGLARWLFPAAASAPHDHESSSFPDEAEQS